MSVEIRFWGLFVLEVLFSAMPIILCFGKCVLASIIGKLFITQPSLSSFHWYFILGKIHGMARLQSSGFMSSHLSNRQNSDFEISVAPILIGISKSSNQLFMSFLKNHSKIFVVRILFTGGIFTRFKFVMGRFLNLSNICCADRSLAR